MKSEVPKKQHHGGFKAAYNKIWDFFFFLLLFPAVIGSVFMAKEVIGFRHRLKQLDKGSNVPNFSDFKLCIPILLVMLILKTVCEKTLVHFTRKIISQKYNTEAQKLESEKVAQKLAQHIFKGSYYLFISLFAVYVLKDLDFFPTYLGGSGKLSNTYAHGFPEAFFFKKSKYFDFHYLICLTYSISDLIYLLFIYEKQTDFLNMLLHHICTISLVLFSFVTNISSVGSVVLLVHNITDICVHTARFSIRANFSEFSRIIIGIILILSFIYFRLFVFGECIYIIATAYYPWDIGWTTAFLVLFLSFLYLLHINWTLRLLEKAYQSIMGNKITDTTTFKKFDELKEKKKE